MMTPAPAPHECLDKCITCHVCAKVYAEPKFLKMHMYIHSEHKCNICNQVCVTEIELKNHQSRKHSNDKPYICNQCKSAFKLSAGLMRHTQKKHPNPNKEEGELLTGA